MSGLLKIILPGICVVYERICRDFPHHPVNSVVSVPEYLTVYRMDVKNLIPYQNFQNDHLKYELFVLLISVF